MRRVAVVLALFALAGRPVLRRRRLRRAGTPRVPVDRRAGADPDEIAVIQRAETVSRQ
jgi:hypothetical protein